MPPTRLARVTPGLQPDAVLSQLQRHTIKEATGIEPASLPAGSFQDSSDTNFGTLPYVPGGTRTPRPFGPRLQRGALPVTLYRHRVPGN